MSSREAVHELVDALPQAALPAVARYLESVCAGAPPDAPEDPEPLAPETEAMIAASRAAVARGAVLTQEQLQAQRAARRESA
jgi:hypothetical protein